MNAAQTNALIVSSFNIHYGKALQRVMTSEQAAKLSRGDRAALCLVLETKGGSDLYDANQARAAYARCVA